MTHRSLISKASGLFLAFGLTLTGLGTAYASDVEDIGIEKSEQDISIEEPSPTADIGDPIPAQDPEEEEDDAGDGYEEEEEDARYTVTLPYEEGYSYKYDEKHVLSDEDEDISMEEDILLAYNAGEKVKFTIKVEDGAPPVDHIRMYDPDDEDEESIHYKEKDHNEYRFTMPENDVYVEVTPGEAPEIDEEPAEVQEEPAQESVTVETSAAPAEAEEEVAQDPEPAEADEEIAEEIVTVETSAAPGVAEEAVYEEPEEAAEEEDPQQAETTAPVAEDSSQQQSAYTAETDEDGTPTQGSIEQVADYTIALNDPSFDAKSDFTNIEVDSSSQTIAYVSDDVTIGVEGRYSSIYRIDTSSGKFWFVLRPVIVSAGAESAPAEDPLAPEEVNAEPEVQEETAAPEVVEEAPAEAAEQTSPEAEQASDIQMVPGTESGTLESSDTLAEYTATYTIKLQAEKDNPEAPLKGALVTFKDPETGEKVGSANSNEDATVVFNTIEEAPSLTLDAVLTTPPAGYVMNDAEYTVRKDGSTTMFLPGITGTIQVITQKQGDTYPERTFVLKKAAGPADDVTITTNEKGVATSDDTLPYGNWDIYEGDKQVGSTTISEDGGISLVYVDAEGNSTSRHLSITIQDNNKNVITGDRTAIFKVFKAEDTKHSGPVKLYKINGEGTETSEYDQFKMDEDGSIQMSGNLENGNYVLTETTAPSGYKTNDNTVEFTVQDNVASYTITIAHVRASESGNDNSEHDETPEESDDESTHTIDVKSTIADADGRALEGVTYVLYDEAGEETLKEATSGEDGIAAFSEVANGTYLLKETSLPEYYAAVLEEDGRKVTVSGEDVTVECEHHLSSFKLVRLYRPDDESTETTPVAGAIYWVAPETSANTESTALAAQIAEIRASEKTNLETLNALEDGAVKDDLLSTYAESSEATMKTLIAEAAIEHGYSGLASGGDFYTTGEDGSFTVMYDGENTNTGLKHGISYTVTEYSVDPTVEMDTTVHRILVDERGQVSEEGEDKGYSYTLKVITGSKPTTATAEITVYKTDGTTPLAGAKLTLTDESGNEVKTWTSDESAYTVTGLTKGTYTIAETEAPESYVPADPVEFPVTEADYGETLEPISVVHKKVYHQVTLIDGDTQEPITGATITVKDDTGAEVETWTTDGSAHKIAVTPATKDSDGNYSPVYFIEPSGVTLPDGYATLSSTTTVYSQETGKVVSTTLKAYKIASRAYVVTEEGKHIAGAQMKVLDASGKEVETWTTDGKSFHQMYLPIGSYTLTEAAVPDYFMQGSDIKFTIKDTSKYQTVTMVNKYITVTFHKVDADTKKELSGAVLTIKDENGKTATDNNGKELTWTTDGTAHSVVMKAGKYTLTEESAPAGYTKAEDIAFSIDNTTENQSVTIANTKILINIHKADTITSKALSGAALVLKDASGNTVDSWTTDGNAHRVSVAAGPYRLTETTAPAGYELAKDVSITVTNESNEQNFYMYDTPKDSTVNLTGKKRTKTKTIKAATKANTASSSASTATADGKGGSNVTSNPSKTGDYNRYIYAIALIVLGMALACLFFIWHGKSTGKKDGEEAPSEETGTKETNEE